MASKGLRKSLILVLTLLFVFTLSLAIINGIDSVVYAEDSITLETFRMGGASVRFKQGETDHDGLRFRAIISKEEYDQFDHTAENFSAGIVVLPSDLLGNNELTKDTPKAKSGEITHWTECREDGVPTMQGYVYLWGIPEESYNRDISARAYITDGTNYWYSDVQARSISYVADGLIKSGADDSEKLQQFLKDYTISFHSNDDYPLNIANKDQTYGSLIGEPIVSREGYGIAGWYSDSDLRTRWDFAKDIVKGPTTLYAKFSPIHDGSIVVGVIKYEGKMIGDDCPYGAGVYTWSTGPTFTATETHGWLTGYGVLDMKNGITYEGPLNAIAVSTEGGNEFQPYTKIDGTVVKDVTITRPEGVFTGELTKYDALKNASTAIKGFFGNAIYLSEGVFVNKTLPTVEVPSLFIPTFAFDLYSIQTSTATDPVVVARCYYVGQYINVGGNLIAFGKGATYWTVNQETGAVDVNAIPRIECDFFYNSMTGVVKFVQVGYTYEGPMSLINFAPEMGATAVTITFGNGDVFVGSWTNVEGVSKLLGTITYAAGGTAEGEVAITLTECVFTAN